MDVVKMHSSNRSVHSVCVLRFAIGRFALAALIFVVIRRMVFSWTPTSCRMSSRVHLSSSYALTAANVGSCTCAPPPGAAAAGCQSRITNVDATTAQFAGRMIGPSGVSGPPGDVTGIGGAAIAKRRLRRVEESAPSTNEAPSQGRGLWDSLFARTSKLRQSMRGLPGRSNELHVHP